MAKRVFVSYQHLSRSWARELSRSLRERGVIPWRDEESLQKGQATEQEIRDSIRDDCHGAILWLTGKAITSDFVMNVELPAILQAVASGPFVFTPVFVDLSPGEASRRVRERTGLEIGGFNGISVDPTDDEQKAASAVAGAYVKSYLSIAPERSAGFTPTVRAVSRDDSAGSRQRAILSLDWRDSYKEEQAAPCSDRLKPALLTSASSLLSAVGPGPIELDLKVHISAAVAIGHAFRRPTGALLVVLLGDEPWPATEDVDPTAYEPLVERLEWGPVHASEVAIEVSISREVGPGVEALVRATGDPFRARLRFAPEGGVSQTALTHPEQANIWARQICDRTVAVRDSGVASSVALFLAAPLALAVFIGWRMNSVGQVRIFEWARNTGPYQLRWHLP